MTLSVSKQAELTIVLGFLFLHFLFYFLLHPSGYKKRATVQVPIQEEPHGKANH